MARSRSFTFDGGAADYFGTALLACLLCLFTLGIGTPWAICMYQSWRTKHTSVAGVRLVFTGTGAGLIGQWVKWWLLCMITIGIYSFWVVPRLNEWVVEHTDFDPRAPIPQALVINGYTFVPAPVAMPASPAALQGHPDQAALDS